MANGASWQTRLIHEAQQHEHKAFLTLTYNDANLPDDYSVSRRPIQLFLKRLRKAYGPLRFFACGEYGDHGLRPHYHLALFGIHFSDRISWRKTASGFVTYRSPKLETLWPFGHSEIGELTEKSAGYIARYMLKKVNGKRAEDHYTRIHPLTGELSRVHPEFIAMSTCPGIGRTWYDEFSGDTFPSDYVVINGQKRPVPRYYTKQLEEAQREKLARERKARAEKHSDNNTPERLAVREESQTLKVAKLKRELE